MKLSCFDLDIFTISSVFFYYGDLAFSSLSVIDVLALSLYKLMKKSLHILLLSLIYM